MDEEKDLKKIENELKKAELEKLKAETEALNISPFSKPTNWLSLLVGLAGIVSAFTQCQASNYQVQKIALESERKVFQSEKELEKKKSELLNAESKIEELKKQRIQKEKLLEQLEIQIKEKQKIIAQNGNISEVQEIDMKIAETISELKSPKILYIQFRGSLQRELMNQLMETLNKQNIPVPSVERVAGNYNNSVRYFHKTDLESATKVKKATLDFFATKGCPISDIILQDLSNSKFNVNQGQLELWLHHSCQKTE